MESQKSITQNAMYFGAITGLVLIIYTIILYVFNALFSQTLGFINYVIIILGIIWGTKVYRDKFNDGEISYSRALGSGVLITLFAAVISGAFTYILYAFIDPELMNKSFIYMEERLIEQGNMSADQIEKIVDMQKEHSTPLKMALWAIPVNTFIGFIISLITSIFLKKEKAPFKENQ